MKKVFTLLLCAFTLSTFAQDAVSDSTKFWKAGGKSSFTFNQVSLTNWSGGGQNSVSGTFLLNTFLNYKKERVNWDNTLEFGYGLNQQGSDKLAKTEDKIYLLSKYGYKTQSKWFYTGLADFKTQVDKGYKDPKLQETRISDWMSPAYLLLSLGMDYKPNDDFSLYISPVTSKMTFVMDQVLSDAGAFGVDPGKNLRAEYGASAKVIYKKADLVKNVDFNTRLDLFSNLQDNPQNVDVDWEVVFNMKINGFLTALASVNVIYDDDVKYVDDQGVVYGARAQVKQIFGFGLNYTFGAK